MLYFYRDSAGKLHSTANFKNIPEENQIGEEKYFCRWDIIDFKHAEEIANELSSDEMKFMAVDCGKNTTPRFDVIEMPQVGDYVSYAFNGDYRPCGEIVKVTKTLQIVTSTGRRFMYKGGGVWKDGSWRMVMGIRNESNPSF
jgi:hypothetical protein